MYYDYRELINKMIEDVNDYEVLKKIYTFIKHFLGL